MGATEVLAGGEGGGEGERERAQARDSLVIFLQIKESLAILNLFMWKFCTQLGSILYQRIDK